jgi:hypothetical protein
MQPCDRRRWSPSRGTIRLPFGLLKPYGGGRDHTIRDDHGSLSEPVLMIVGRSPTIRELPWF